MLYGLRDSIRAARVCRCQFPNAIRNGCERWAVASECCANGGVLKYVGRVTMVDDKSIADALLNQPCGSKCCIGIHFVHDLMPRFDVLAALDRMVDRDPD